VNRKNEIGIKINNIRGEQKVLSDEQERFTKELTEATENEKEINKKYEAKDAELQNM